MTVAWGSWTENSNRVRLLPAGLYTTPASGFLFCRSRHVTCTLPKASTTVSSLQDGLHSCAKLSEGKGSHDDAAGHAVMRVAVCRWRHSMVLGTGPVQLQGCRSWATIGNASWVKLTENPKIWAWCETTSSQHHLLESTAIK